MENLNIQKSKFYRNTGTNVRCMQPLSSFRAAMQLNKSRKVIEFLIFVIIIHIDIKS